MGFLHCEIFSYSKRQNVEWGKKCVFRFGPTAPLCGPRRFSLAVDLAFAYLFISGVAIQCNSCVIYVRPTINYVHLPVTIIE